MKIPRCDIDGEKKAPRFGGTCKPRGNKTRVVFTGLDWHESDRYVVYRTRDGGECALGAVKATCSFAERRVAVPCRAFYGAVCGAGHCRPCARALQRSLAPPSRASFARRVVCPQTVESQRTVVHCSATRPLPALPRVAQDHAGRELRIGLSEIVAADPRCVCF